ncbi:MAG: PilZ domain-containing protein [Dokdonella sp.]|nr:MAG: PilZ domain-containing protein [Dokdonella sp.]
MSPHQKFRAARKRPDHAVAIIDQMTGERIGHLGNLSLTGMMVVCERPVVEDALYQLSFGLGDGVGTHNVEVGAHQQWSAPGTVHGQQWVGFHFIDVSEPDEAALQQWLETAEDAD